MRKLFQNKVTIILLIIALVVLLAACNQNQGASEQAGEQIKDASEWKKQEIILKKGVPYAMDEQGDSTKLGEVNCKFKFQFAKVKVDSKKSLQK